MQEFVNGLQSISVNNINNQDLQLQVLIVLGRGFYRGSYFLSLRTINW